MHEIRIEGSNIVILAIFVLWLGNLITGKVAVLQKYSIPLAVTGGLICSLIVALIGAAGGPAFIFDMQLRDLLLLVFFSTIGISAKLARLKSGGKALGILVLCAAVFLALQNVTGVLLAMAFGGHPGLGLFAGSVSLAGGHGTAIAWGQEAAAAGLVNAELVGIAFATFGLVAGGIIGGPIAERLILKHQLLPSAEAGSSPGGNAGAGSESLAPVALERALRVLVVLAVCVSFGDVINRWLFHNEIKLPGFLTAMLVGIIITNFCDKVSRPLPGRDFDMVGEIALQLFLAISLMSMDLSSLAGAFGPVFIVLCVQIFVITFFAVQLIFRVMGQDYDAAVIAGGFCGLGMRATPVAIANMSSVTRKYGPSFKAFLIVPLVGAFFIGLPIMQQAISP